MTPIISIVGYSDAGKTTLVEKLVPQLKKKGYRVGTIKHSEHESNFDTRGKDSWRHFASGADAVLVASAARTVLIRKRQNMEKDSHDQLAALEKQMADMDVIIAEGYKHSRFPKIEVFRSEVHETLFCSNDDTLAAIVTDDEIFSDVPVFGLEESGRLADFIEQTFLSAASGEK